MDEQEQVAERSLDDLTKVELEAKIANDRVRIQTLAAKGENMTSAELAEVRKLRAQAPEITGRIDAFKAELEPVVIETPAPVAVETPAPVVPAPAPVAEVTDAQIAEVIAEAEKAAVGGDLVAASAGTATFVALSETTPKSKGAGFKAASASSDGQVAVNDALSLEGMAKLFLDEAEARRQTNQSNRYVRLAAANVMSDEWDLPGLATGNGTTLNAKIIAEGKRRHRAMVRAKESAGLKVAAPLGALPTPIGIGYQFIDLDLPFATTNGSEIIDRIAPIPLAAASNACSVEYQLPHSKADLAGAAVVWTPALQAAVDPDDSSTWKPLITPPMVGTEQVTSVAFPVGLVTEHCYRWQNPSAFAQDLHIVESLANDVRVSYALGRFDQKCRPIAHNASTGYGALVELLGTMRVINGYISSLGLAPEFTDYGLIIDSGLVDLLAYDEDAAGSYGRGVTSRSELMGELSSFGMPVYEVSQTEPTRSSPWALFAGALPAVGAGAAVALPPAPTTFKVRVIDFAGWWKFGAPEIAFGLVEDLSMARQNRAAMFGESFLGMGYDAPSEQFSISITLEFSGMRAARVDNSASLPLFN